jgi:hypothetical protein
MSLNYGSLSGSSMALDELLRQEMSRAQTDFVVNIVLQQPALFDELWAYYLHAEDPLNRRARIPRGDFAIEVAKRGQNSPCMGGRKYTDA